MTEKDRLDFLRQYEERRRELLENMIMAQENIAWAAAQRAEEWSAEEVGLARRIREIMNGILPLLDQIRQERQDIAGMWDNYEAIKQMHNGYLRKIAGGQSGIGESAGRFKGANENYIGVAVCRLASVQIVHNISTAISQKDDKVLSVINGLEEVNVLLARLMTVVRERGLNAVNDLLPEGEEFAIHRPLAPADRRLIEQRIAEEARQKFGIDLSLSDMPDSEDLEASGLKPFDAEERRYLLGDAGAECVENSEADYDRVTLEEENGTAENTVPLFLRPDEVIAHGS